MQNNQFTTTITVDQTPAAVFQAITNVRGWWSEEIEGPTHQLNDEFLYHYKDVHRTRMKLIEVVPDQKIAWLVLDNYFSFTADQNEWTGNIISFEIMPDGNQTTLRFTHQGLVPAYECYNACVNGWTQYIQTSLFNLITTGKGQPNTSKKAYTIHEIAARFSELAKQEKWFEIQDEFFSDDVKSIDPPHSPYFGCAEGKAAVRKKGEDFVSKIETVHRSYTSEPVIGGNHFAVGRELDMTVKNFGRIQMNEIMIYEVKDGMIISEQFIY